MVGGFIFKMCYFSNIKMYFLEYIKGFIRYLNKFFYFINEETEVLGVYLVNGRVRNRI